MSKNDETVIWEVAGLQAEAKLRQIDGRLEVVEIALKQRGGKCVPIDAATLRSLTVADALAARAEPSIEPAMKRHREVMQVEGVAEVSGLSSADAALLPYANDALLVSELLSSGDRAPARALSVARGISPRSAQGRIARAREHGLLTKVPHGTIGGRSTSAAQRVVKKAEAVTRKAMA